MKVTHLALLILLAAPPLLADNSQSEAFRQSYTMEAQKNYEGAIRAIAAVYNQHPRNFFLNLRMGWLNYLKGNFKNAISHYDSALVSQPKAINAGLGKINTLFALGDWVGAEKACKKLLEVAPTDYLANLKLAYAYQYQKQYGEAVKVVSQELSYYPESIELLNTKGYFLKLASQNAESEKIFKEVLTLSPDNAIAKGHLNELTKTN